MKAIKYILIALLGCALLTACEHKHQEVVNKKFVLSDTMRKMIRLDTVSHCSVEGELSLSGIISFNENNVVKVFPRSGGQVIEAKVSLGDKVVKGQTLAIIKSADVAGVYNDLGNANADLAIAKRQMENTESLYKNGISSEKEYNEAKQNYQKALGSRDKIQALISINGGGRTSAEGNYIVTAPINGYIVEKKVTAGTFIRPDMSEGLYTISDLQSVWVYATVYEADIASVQQGSDVQVLPISYPGKVFTGKIDQVSNVLDPQSKTMKVRINIANKAMLMKPDMFVKVIVSNKQSSDAICIPTAGVISQDGHDYVVVYNNDSDMQIAEVGIIKTVGARTYIKDGVKEKEVIITDNQLFIFNQLLNE